MKSFRVAMAGIRDALSQERNLRIQLVMALYVLAFGALAGLEAWAWAVCLICVAMVLRAEVFNTALERLCDAVTLERNERIRLCKDMAAGGVLISAVLSAAAGLVVFFRPEPLARLEEQFRLRPWVAVVLAVLIVPCLFFIKGRPSASRKGEP